MSTPFERDDESQGAQGWRELVWRDLTTKGDKYDDGTLLHHALTGVVIALVIAFAVVAIGLASIVVMLVGRALGVG